MNKRQTEELENLQYSALKIVYGYDLNKKQLLELSSLPTLEKRRADLFRNFCVKVNKNPRFNNSWLVTRNFVGHDLRQQKIIVEKYARTERLFRSPLYTMRRNLNDIIVT